MSNIIEMINLKKIYKIGSEKIIALDNINLNIVQGEITCFLGTSGSGKSTLLNMMAGLEKPSKGQIKIKGERIDKMNEKKITLFRQKHIGFIFQSYNLLNAYTALENVSLPLVFRGMSKKERNKRARGMLKAVNLGDRMLHKPNQLSGGQQQRVGIARAFITRPEIVFADEPTGNLDSKTTKEVMSLIISMAEKYKQTLIIVTHDPTIAAYADTVIHVLDGSIEKIERREVERKLPIKVI